MRPPGELPNAMHVVRTKRIVFSQFVFIASKLEDDRRALHHDLQRHFGNLAEGYRTYPKSEHCGSSYCRDRPP